MSATADVLQMALAQMLCEHLFSQLLGSNATNKANLQGFWQLARTPVCFHGVPSSHPFLFFFFFLFLADILYHDSYFAKWLDRSPFFTISFGGVFFYSTSSVFLRFLFIFYPLFHCSLSFLPVFAIFHILLLMMICGVFFPLVGLRGNCLWAWELSVGDIVSVLLYLSWWKGDTSKTEK